MPCVCMLVYDRELIDYRIIYEANSLTEAGYDVHIIMPSDTEFGIQALFGVQIHYINVGAPPWHLLFRLAMARSWHQALHYALLEFTKDFHEVARSSSSKASGLEQAEALTKTKTSQPQLGMIATSNQRANLSFGLRKLCKQALRLTNQWHIVNRIVLPRIEAGFAAWLDKIQPDIIHTHDLPPLRVATYMARKLKCKLVYDAHELFPEQGGLTSKEARFWRHREEADIHKPDLIITVNSFLSAFLEKEYSVSNVQVIHNTSVIIDYSSIRSESRAKLTEQLRVDNDRCCILLYLGSVGEGRGVTELVEALSLLPDHYLLAILGDGAEMAKIRELVERLGLQNRVAFLGFVPRSEVAKLIVGADIGLVTQQATGLNEINCSPNRLSDYVIAGLPLAVSDLNFLRCFVERNACGDVFDPGDPRDIAETIQGMFEEPLKFDLLRANATATAKQFNWNVESRKFLELYAQLN